MKKKLGSLYYDKKIRYYAQLVQRDYIMCIQLQTNNKGKALFANLALKMSLTVATVQWQHGRHARVDVAGKLIVILEYLVIPGRK